MHMNTYTSRRGCICESQELPGRPPSRAKDLDMRLVKPDHRCWMYFSALTHHSCLEVVVTPLTEHDTTSMRIMTARNLVAGTEFVAFNTTSIYGCPVGEFVADSMSPRQNIKVTYIA